MNKFISKYALRTLIIFSFFFNSKIIFCIQLKLKLENQVYQFPINHNLYRRLKEEPLRDLYFYEYETPSITLALPILQVNIASPSQNFSLIYSTGKHVSWVFRYKSNNEELSQKYFDTEKSKTLIRYKEIYEINSFTFGTLGSQVKDYISITNTTPIFMSFILIFFLSPNNIFADGELSFNRKYLGIYSDPYITKNVSNFSLMEGLYNNGFIKNKIFAHKWIKGKNEGILYIDEFPLSEEEKNYYDFYICKSYNKRSEVNQFWNCFIDGIRIGNKYRINYTNDIGIFSTSENFIFVPEKNYELIDYIKNYSTWGKNNCFLEEWTAYKELRCNYKGFKYSYFPDIFINFNGYEIKISPEDVFYYNDNKKFFRLLIVLFNKKDYWVFGSLLTNKNNMIFDGENGTVTFFQKREIFSSSLVVNYLLIILLFLILIGIYFILKMKHVNIKENSKEFTNSSEKTKLIE